MACLQLVAVAHSVVGPNLPWLEGQNNAPLTSPVPGSPPVLFVGAFAKSGTKAITTIFQQAGFSAAHEHNGGALGQLWIEYKAGNKSRADIVDWLRNWYARNPVQVSVHFLNSDILPIILETFPETRFIVPVRHVDDWANSMYDQAPTGAAMFAPVTRMQIGPEDYDNLPPEEDTAEVRNHSAVLLPSSL